MGVKSRGRGAAATFGMLVLLAGIAGAVVLWVMADRRPEQAVERFARGPVGCTTTLEFADTGTFYVYRERVGDGSDAFDECAPVADDDRDFDVELLDGGRRVALRDDTSVDYDTPLAVGESVARVVVDEPGRYELVVQGSDPSVVAAVGRDPEQGVDDLRRGAFAVGAFGVVLGALLLVLAGRRSRRAASVSTPAGPGWGPGAHPPDAAPAWPPEPPRVPVNPLLVPEPRAEPWAPPRAEERRDRPPPGSEP